MRKLLSFFIAVFFITASAGNARAFVQGRYHWWKLHLAKLTAEKRGRIDTVVPDNGIVRLLNAEIKRSREMISIFESGMRQDGSLLYVTRHFTREEMHHETKKLFPSLFAVYYLDALIAAPLQGRDVKGAKEIARRYCTGYIQKSFPPASSYSIDHLLRRTISAEQWKKIAVEIYINRLILDRGRLYAALLAATMKRVEQGAILRKDVFNRLSLRRLINDSAESAFSGEAAAGDAALENKSLAGSPAWQGPFAAIKGILDNCGRIASLFPAGSVPSLKMILLYEGRPGELNEIYFRGKRTRFLFRKEFAFTPVKVKGTRGTGGRPVTVIDNRPLITSIDKLRARVLPSLTGNEDDAFFRELTRRFKRIELVHISRIRDGIFRDGHGPASRPLHVKMKGAKTVPAASDIQKGDALIADMRKLTKTYINESVAFIKTVSGMKQVGPDRVSELYSRRLQRYRKYLHFMKGLFKEGTRVVPADGPRARKRLYISYRRSPVIYRITASSASIERSLTAGLNGDDVLSMRRKRRVFLDDVSVIQQEIKTIFQAYAHRANNLANKNRKRMSGLREKVAQREMNLLFADASECAGLYSGLNYGEYAFALYRTEYKRLRKAAGDELITPELKETVRMRSLFSLVKGFDRERLKGEFAARRYIRTKGRTAVARLLALMKFYRRKGVRVPFLPEVREIARMREVFHKKGPSARIGSWRMTEANFALVDSKAARRLEKIYNMIIWKGEQGRHKPAVSGTEKKDVPIRRVKVVSSPFVSFVLPDGWSEESVGTMEDYRGVLRAFVSDDVSSTIHLVRIPLSGLSLKRAVEKWSKRSGAVPVEKGWKMRQNVEYFWLITKSPGRYIIESYTIPQNGYAIIISGKTTRKRYRYFRNILKRVIDSMDFKKKAASRQTAVLSPPNHP